MLNFKIKFWGVRGSYPVCGKKFIKYGGNTTCLSMEIDNRLLVFDAGTGIINLGDKLENNKKYNAINLFFSHTHIDHIQGLPYFLPAYSNKITMNIFASAVFEKNIEQVLKTLMSYQFFPVKFNQLSCNKKIFHINENQLFIIRKNKNIPQKYNEFHGNYNIEEDDVIIRMAHESNHPVGGVSIYKVEYKGRKVVFATDFEGYAGGNTKLIEFAQNADILIHDCTYNEEQYLTRKGWGHSTPLMAAENAKKAGVKKLFLTHHAPDEDENSIAHKLQTAKKEFKNTYLAYEELEIQL